jgi:hypothetical protein
MVVALVPLGGESRAWPVPHTILRPIAKWVTGSAASCPQGTSNFDGACFAQEAIQKLSSVSPYIRAHTSPADKIAVYPFENIYGILSGRQISGAVLQQYVAMGRSLTDRQIDQYEVERPTLAIISAEPTGTIAIDQVPNLSRNSAIWLYLQSHYSSEATPSPGVVVARRDDERAARWRVETTPIHVHTSTSSGPTVERIGLDALDWPARSDLISVRLIVAYTPLWKLLKPSAVSIAIRRVDGSMKNMAMVLEPNQLQEIWLYPWGDDDLANYFSSDQARWRVSNRPAVAQVTIHFCRCDLFSLRPSSIWVGGISAVRLSLLPRG